MRTFLGIELPSHIKEEIVNSFKKFREKNPDIKYVTKENLHITLKFLGDVEEKEINKIKEISKTIAKRFSPFNAIVKGFGAFPSFSRARVVWVGLNKGRDIVSKLNYSLEQELSKIGFSAEKKEYIPHITIGRLRNARALESKEEYQSSEFLITQFTLFQSTLTPKGPIYHPLGRFKLG